jgi:thymidylate synthase (FAD)
MQIIKPYARMLSPTTGNADTIVEPGLPFMPGHGRGMLRRIEYFARVSHASEDKQTYDSWDRFLRSVVLQHGDWSVTEHEKVSCEFVVDRGVTHEIVRHRIGSYTQESTRFVNYQKRGGEAKFIMPIGMTMYDSSAMTTETNAWVAAIEQAEKSYMEMVEIGIKPQIARSVFPNALASKIIVTYNLRGWRHFFIMRTSAEAHPQMREVVDPLLEDFKKNIPILYEDIQAGERQATAMRKAR